METPRPFKKGTIQFLSRNAVHALAVQPGRDCEIVSGGASPRLGYCIDRALAWAKGVYFQHLSVAPPELRIAFRANPGLAPGAAIFWPLRGMPCRRSEFCNRDYLHCGSDFVIGTGPKTGLIIVRNSDNEAGLFCLNNVTATTYAFQNELTGNWTRKVTEFRHPNAVSAFQAGQSCVKRYPTMAAAMTP
jgi:hypothetical protein